MNKRMRELLQAIEEKNQMASNLLNAVPKDDEEKQANLTKIKALTEDIKDIKNEYQAVKDLFEAGKIIVDGNDPVNDNINDSERYSNAFYNALRGKATSEDAAIISQFNNALSSQTGEDGGYLIPDDQQVAIRELRRQMGSLEELVNVEPVGTLTGSRVLEKDAQYTPFTSFTEAEDVPASDSPQFVTISYTITDKGGILPVPNNLLNDNAANLKAYINKWLAKKQTATRNSVIYTLLNAMSKTVITNDVTAIDDIKDILDVTLDPAISLMSKVVTNQSGFNFLNKLKNSDGDYLLEKDPKNPTQKLLDGRIVKVYSNKVLPNRNDTANWQAPIIIGSFTEGVTLFDRQALSILATQIGGTAFTKNRTEIRGITREDVKVADSAALVFGEVAVGASV